MKRIFAGLTALLLAAGGVVLTAAPASAHTSAVTGVASCETDGTYTVEWTYNATNVPEGVEAETKAMTTNQGSLAVVDGINKGGQIFLSVWTDHQVNVPGTPVKTGNWSGKFKAVGIPGNFVGDVTTMVQTDWKNGPSEDPVGKVTVDGTCKPPVVVPEKPADTITVTPVETVDCDTRTITTTTTTVTTGTRLENNVWVPTEPVLTSVVTTRDAPAEVCPIVVEPPAEEEPPVVVPPVFDQPKVVPAVVTPVENSAPVATELAATGGPNPLPLILAVAAILLVGTTMVLFGRGRTPNGFKQ